MKSLFGPSWLTVIFILETRKGITVFIFPGRHNIRQKWCIEKSIVRSMAYSGREAGAWTLRWLIPSRQAF